MDDLVIIIPAAGLGRRMKSYGPKSLLIIEDKNLIHRQIKILTDKYPNSKIVVVAGFEYEKVNTYIEEKLDSKLIKVLLNYKYKTTNVAKSISLAAEKYPANNYLIVYGDLIFNKETIENLNFDKSGIVLDTNDQFDSMEIGVKYENEAVVNFSYSILKKWAHILYLDYKDMNLFNAIVNRSYQDKFLTYEILNKMISKHNLKLKVYENPSMFIQEIDDSKDIEKAEKLAGEGKF